MSRNFLFLIPARGGSKGIPGKNIKLLNGVPLIYYAIDLARQFTRDDMICVSTDDAAIASLTKKHGLPVWFTRPKRLAGDKTETYDVIIHALHHCFRKSFTPDAVVLLQPTSPLRLKKHVAEAIRMYSSKIDMVVAVKRLKKNPYATIYKAMGRTGISRLFSQAGNRVRRQDAGQLFELNGAVYIFNVSSLLKKQISEFTRIRGVVMPELNSVDLDENSDWQFCEFLMNSKSIRLDYKIKK